MAVTEAVGAGVGTPAGVLVGIEFERSMYIEPRKHPVDTASQSDLIRWADENIEWTIELIAITANFKDYSVDVAAKMYVVSLFVEEALRMNECPYL